MLIYKQFKLNDLTRKRGGLERILDTFIYESFSLFPGTVKGVEHAQHITYYSFKPLLFFFSFSFFTYL